MDIRPARDADVEHVLPMVAKICALHEQWDPDKYGFLSEPQERYRRWLGAKADDARAVFLVGEHEGKIVSFLIATVEQEIPIYRLKEYGFIHDLWVEAEYRHEGVARQMVMLAIEKFQGIGVAQVRLDTAGPNKPARKLFASCGFRVSTIEMLLKM